MSNLIEIVCVCPICGKPSIVEVKEEHYSDWQNGKLVQESFPYLNGTEREMLISNLRPNCQDMIFGE